jgi:hypothetical protein
LLKACDIAIEFYFMPVINLSVRYACLIMTVALTQCAVCLSVCVQCVWVSLAVGPPPPPRQILCYAMPFLLVLIANDKKFHSEIILSQKAKQVVSLTSQTVWSCDASSCKQSRWQHCLADWVVDLSIPWVHWTSWLNSGVKIVQVFKIFDDKYCTYTFIPFVIIMHKKSVLGETSVTCKARSNTYRGYPVTPMGDFQWRSGNGHNRASARKRL